MMAMNHNKLQPGESMQSERLESALYFIRSLQEQACLPKLEQFSFSPNSNSAGTEIRENSSIEPTSDGGSLATTDQFPGKDVTLATAAFKFQPALSMMISSRNQPRKNSAPTAVSPPPFVSRNHSPRCSICPYEWDGQLPGGLGGAKIYRLNPAPGEDKREV